MVIRAFGAGAGKVGWKFTTRSVEGGVNTPFTLSNIGYIGVGVDDPYTKLRVSECPYKIDS